jgi:hypothetical protein
MLDGVRVIRARFLKELLKVVCWRSFLALAVARGLHSVFRAGTAYLLIDATVVVGCGLLTTLFAPLLAGLNALLGAVDGNVEQRFPATARGQLKLGHLSAGGTRSGDVAPSFDDASWGVGRRVERPQPCSAISMALCYSCHRPLGDKSMSPPSALLIVAWVPCTPFRHATSTSHGPCCHSKAWGEKSTGSGGAILAVDGIPSGLCRLVLNQTRLGLASEWCHQVHSTSYAVPMVRISVSWR